MRESLPQHIQDKLCRAAVRLLQCIKSPILQSGIMSPIPKPYFSSIQPRQCAGAAEEMVSKSIGFHPQEFQRLALPFTVDFRTKRGSPRSRARDHSHSERVSRPKKNRDKLSEQILPFGSASEQRSEGLRLGPGSRPLWRKRTMVFFLH